MSMFVFTSCDAYVSLLLLRLLLFLPRCFESLTSSVMLVISTSDTPADLRGDFDVYPLPGLQQVA